MLKKEKKRKEKFHLLHGLPQAIPVQKFTLDREKKEEKKKETEVNK